MGWSVKWTRLVGQWDREISYAGISLIGEKIKIGMLEKGAGVLHGYIVGSDGSQRLCA